jgi:hypothetical protein
VEESVMSPERALLSAGVLTFLLHDSRGLWISKKRATITPLLPTRVGSFTSCGATIETKPPERFIMTRICDLQKLSLRNRAAVLLLILGVSAFNELRGASAAAVAAVDISNLPPHSAKT